MAELLKCEFIDKSVPRFQDCIFPVSFQLFHGDDPDPHFACHYHLQWIVSREVIDGLSVTTHVTYLGERP